MQSTTFFPGTARRATVTSPTLLVGKNKTRKIRLYVTMPLSGEAVMGMPNWLSEAYTAVAQHFNEIKPEIESISDISVHFSNLGNEPDGELFDSLEIKVPGAELKKFSVCRIGDAEEPDVALKMTAYAAFSRALWQWLGELAGDPVRMSFPSGHASIEIASADKPSLIALEPDDERIAQEDAILDADAPLDPLMEFDEDDPQHPAFEASVRASIGAPEPFSEKPRLVSVKPRSEGGSGKGKLTVN